MESCRPNDDSSCHRQLQIWLRLLMKVVLYLYGFISGDLKFFLKINHYICTFYKMYNIYICVYMTLVQVLKIK